MKKQILVADYSTHKQSDLIKYVSAHQGHILFNDERKCTLLAEADQFTPPPITDYSIIEDPHQDLLPSFFNLIKDSKINSLLLLSSHSLISLMSFYQNIITHCPLKAIEINYTEKYYGLLSGDILEINPPENVKYQWFTAGNSGNITYK